MLSLHEGVGSVTCKKQHQNREQSARESICARISPNSWMVSPGQAGLVPPNDTAKYGRTPDSGLTDWATQGVRTAGPPVCPEACLQTFAPLGARFIVQLRGSGQASRQVGRWVGMGLEMLGSKVDQDREIPPTSILFIKRLVCARQLVIGHGSQHRPRTNAAPRKILSKWCSVVSLADARFCWHQEKAPSQRQAREARRLLGATQHGRATSAGTTCQHAPDWDGLAALGVGAWHHRTQGGARQQAPTTSAGGRHRESE